MEGRPLRNQCLVPSSNPHYVGIVSFLASRGIALPRGKESDEEDQESVYALGNKKNRLFNELLKVKGVEIYKSTVELIKVLLIHTSHS